MKKERTQNQINEQISWLKENKKKIPSHNGFGDSNWDQIDAQILVLEEDLTEDNVYEKQDNGEFDDNETDAALWTISWRDDGDDSVEPSKDWAALVSEK